MKSVILALILMVVCAIAASGQQSNVEWKRRTPSMETELRAFHSTQSINLPTVETIDKGLFLFEISHRFLPPVSDGFDVLYGFDGPVIMRLGLGYAVTDNAMMTLARSNQDDNVDLQIKYKLFSGKEGFPVKLAINWGVAWSTDVIDRERSDGRNFQFYAQFITNLKMGQKSAFGIVPSYLENSIVHSEETERALTLGIYAQYYISKLLSFMAEVNIVENGYYFNNDPAAFGIELETGGHFFKIILTNSTALNQSQYLIGTNSPFETDQWRIGFNITRLLHF